MRKTLFLGKDRLTIPKCVFCKNFIDEEEVDGMLCVAFPKGIPDNIMRESEENECNNGIKYKEE